MTNHPFFGFDTETDDLGTPILMATNENYTMIHNFDSVLEFLGNKKYKNAVFWTWNLTFDAEGLLKLCLQDIPETEDWRIIAKQMQTGGNKEEGIKSGYSYRHKYLGDINIFYIKSKFLSISMNKHRMQFYDIAQFYGHSRLETQAQVFLKEGKEDLAGWVDEVKKCQSGKITHKQLQKYLFENYDEVGYYCQKDADLTLRLSEVMRQAFLSVDIPFDKPMSQAKIAEEYILQNVKYPIVARLKSTKITEYHNVAQKAYHGGIFETVQRGLFEEPIYDYDINSAYPASMAGFDHWGNGSFQEVETPSDGVRFGWYGAEFNCKWIPYPDDKDPYFIDYRLLDHSEEQLTDVVTNNRILYPTGKRVQVITRVELEFMLKHGFKVNVFAGVEWVKNSDKYLNPFAWIPEKYTARQEIKKANKDDMRQYALKILLNSTYGKTAQSKFPGEMTNYFYASYITAETRIKIAEVALKHEKNVIDIATDGICLNCPCPELDISEDNLGEWKESIYSSALFVGSGIRQMFYEKPDKKGNTYETFARGLTNDKQFDLKGAMESNLKEIYLKSIKVRPLHLNECVSHTKLLNLSDVNKFNTVEKRLNVNTDKKHIWSKNYIDFEDFLNNKSFGKPLDIKNLL